MDGLAEKIKWARGRASAPLSLQEEREIAEHKVLWITALRRSGHFSSAEILTLQEMLEGINWDHWRHARIIAGCFAVETIANQCHVSVSTVQAARAKARKLGTLSKIDNGHRGRKDDKSSSRGAWHAFSEEWLRAEIDRQDAAKKGVQNIGPLFGDFGPLPEKGVQDFLDPTRRKKKRERPAVPATCPHQRTRQSRTVARFPCCT